MKIILAGFQGVGKTSCGRLLSEKLKLPFLDTDALLEEKWGRPVHELYNEFQEKRFRNEEAKILASLSRERGVLSLGGGSLSTSLAQSIVAKLGSVVYLYQSFESLPRKRVGAFLDEKAPEKSLRQLFLKRHPIFCQLSHHVIEVGNKLPQEIVEEIWQVMALEATFA